MGTSKIIDVLIALDVEEILKNYPSLSQSKEQPTLLTNAVDCIYMLTTRANAVYGYGPNQGGAQGEGGNDLNVKASVNDSIRWRTVSLTDTAEYTCFLYEYKLVTSSIGKDLLGKKTYETANVSEPYPVEGWPEVMQVQREPRADFKARATVLNAGSEIYYFYVAIYDNLGHLKGYIRWDPRLTVSG
ncbi:hypothetical protein DF107_28735 [Burkholderia stagnalis]|uniref:AidA/PixA family protein n=1 Tax=Burkholderia stagnalis TaxID=1503054 RepID=UPI00075F2562|nr:AidA/PixA family protein [Burkholderia stagnalis]KVL95010.1 hypothetical protein WT02_17275 [Burkholderia stagnalis]KVL98253.1 hypothetical protein WT03_08420 [Burkholderia stagnalis]KVM03803.1 hypothetical protein WT04_26750 [Burkholderia stagnalis]KVX61949.1 hypothetical protein WT33_17170 [Burkholderia stagnalis]KWI25677.1 hypothetical protein WT71_21885 [Burkholderia stagnalis]